MGLISDSVDLADFYPLVLNLLMDVTSQGLEPGFSRFSSLRGQVTFTRPTPHWYIELSFINYNNIQILTPKKIIIKYLKGFIYYIKIAILIIKRV